MNGQRRHYSGRTPYNGTLKGRVREIRSSFKRISERDTKDLWVFNSFANPFTPKRVGKQTPTSSHRLCMGIRIGRSSATACMRTPPLKDAPQCRFSDGRNFLGFELGEG